MNRDAMSQKFAALWDVDGTLVDTGEMHFRAWRKMSQELGVDFTREHFRATFGRRNPEIIRFIYGDHISETESQRIANTKERYYMDEARQGVQLLPGVRTLLEQLQRADFKQAIGSSAPRANLELILDLTDSRRFFETVVAMEDTSRGKPDPEVFLTGASRLGITPSQCVVFEDAVAGVQAAKAAGMKCVAVTFVGHHGEEKLLEAGADRCVNRLDELTADDVRKLFK